MPTGLFAKSGIAVLNRVARAFRRHGFVKFWPLLLRNIRYYLRPSAQREDEDPAGRSLDAALGVETTGIRETGSLEIDSRNVGDAVRYQPSGVGLVRQTLRACTVDYQEYVFIDFGCGKGRVLLLAAELPFRSVLGIEFSAELQQTAQRNIAACEPRLQGSRDIRAVLGDAANFEPPEVPLLCYFYNPFGEAVMRQVAGNLERSLERARRPIWVIYVEPLHQQVFDPARWTTVTKEKQYVIYRNRE